MELKIESTLADKGAVGKRLPHSPTESPPPACSSPFAAVGNNNIFNQFGKHVTSSSKVLSPDGNANYDLFGNYYNAPGLTFRGNANSLDNSIVSLSDDGSSNSSNATLRASGDEGYTREMPKKQCCGSGKSCALCYYEYQLPFMAPQRRAPTHQPTLGLRFELRPIQSCCQCHPCQCTFETNYCGCHSDMTKPCF